MNERERTLFIHLYNVMKYRRLSDHPGSNEGYQWRLAGL
jgi:hypothetical protein